MERGFDISGNGEFDCPFCVVPVEGDSTKDIAIPVRGDGVFL